MTDSRVGAFLLIIFAVVGASVFTGIAAASAWGNIWGTLSALAMVMSAVGMAILADKLKPWILIAVMIVWTSIAVTTTTMVLAMFLWYALALSFSIVAALIFLLTLYSIVS